MPILRDFERRLGSLVEGLFAKTFRGALQPVELAKRILREMDAGQTRGVTEVWAPNHFLFRLSPQDREHFEQAEHALVSELRKVIRDNAIERGWGLVGPPEVEFEVDDGIGRGEFRCVASLVEGEERLEPGTPTGDLAVASLVMLEDERPIRTFHLSAAVTTIGRLPDCDVVIADPGASRRHAEVRNQEGAWLLADLGSTNGTLVNGAMAASHVLQEGDRITIGNTVLEFREG